MAAERSLYLFCRSDDVERRFRELPDLSADLVVLSPDEIDAAKQRIEFKSSLLIVVDVRPQVGSSELLPLFEMLGAHPESDWQLVALTDGSISGSLASPLFQLVEGFLDEETVFSSADQLTEALRPYLETDRSSSRLRHAFRLSVGGMFVETYTPSVVALLKQLEKIASHDVTLMLIGETGTGKTTLAKIMHLLSRRRDGVFQNVACGALPKDLIESELFGHTRGAFTGAERSRVGRFEAAKGGTLLLDEIDLLGAPEQAKLLRVIETGEYEMVGSTETRHTDARVIVASNIPLDELMKDEKFRPDLYYRLNVLQFRLPQLKDRVRDIVPLALRTIEDLCAEHGITIASIDLEFLEALEAYHWPGNIRELKNHLRRAVLFSDNRELRLDHLTAEVIEAYQNRGMDVSQSALEGEDDDVTLADQVARNEREILIDTLKANNFKRTDTAKALGISRVGLYKKMKKYDLLDDKAQIKESA